jgi:hypothetical protein
MADPKGKYRYTGEPIVGNDPALGFYPDTIVKVREVVPADVKGAHTDDEDAVVFEWETDGQVVVSVREQPYTSPEPLVDSEGNPRLDGDGNPMFVGVQRVHAVPVLGPGKVTRAMSMSVDEFNTHFEKARR